ncbi:MAG: hypothetical protein ACOCZ9_04195, partial [Spirochaetota bacterium]
GAPGSSDAAPESSAGAPGTCAGAPRPTRGADSPPRFELFRRFTHVLEESRRVEQLGLALEASDVAAVGRLMNQSHESCRDLYEISCPELDELVEVERNAGAIGARMTGAGFGGCTVYLAEHTAVEGSIREIIEKYYRGSRGLSRDDYSDLIFPVRAVSGVSWL